MEGWEQSEDILDTQTQRVRGHIKFITGGHEQKLRGAKGAVLMRTPNGWFRQLTHQMAGSWTKTGNTETARLVMRNQ